MESNVGSGSQPSVIDSHRLRQCQGLWGETRQEIVTDLKIPGSAHANASMSHERCGAVSVVGSCSGPVIVRASEVKDFYCGYCLIGIPTAVIAVLAGIVFFAIGVLS